MEHEGDSCATVHPLSNVTTLATASTLMADDEAVGRSGPSISSSSAAAALRDDSAGCCFGANGSSGSNGSVAAALSPLSRAFPANSTNLASAPGQCGI